MPPFTVPHEPTANVGRKRTCQRWLPGPLFGGPLNGPCRIFDVPSVNVPVALNCRPCPGDTVAEPGVTPIDSTPGFTVTVKLRVAVLPAASRAVSWTDVFPCGNVDPDAIDGVIVGLGSARSATNGNG